MRGRIRLLMFIARQTKPLITGCPENNQMPQRECERTLQLI
jgi:hypothetical protein